MAQRIITPHYPQLDRLLSVDPGDNTGWAYWDGTLVPRTGQITLSRSKGLQLQEDQLAYMWEGFDALLSEWEPKSVLIEGVEFWSGSAKSRAAASRQNLFKLAYLVGGYAQAARYALIDFGFLPANDWKGQMDKHAVAVRVQRVNGQTYPTTHITDAVGLGLAWAGVFNRG